MPGWRNWQTQRTQNAQHVVCNSRSSNSFRVLASLRVTRILCRFVDVVLGFGHGLGTNRWFIFHPYPTFAGSNFIRTLPITNGWCSPALPANT